MIPSGDLRERRSGSSATKRCRLGACRIRSNLRIEFFCLNTLFEVHCRLIDSTDATQGLSKPNCSHKQCASYNLSSEELDRSEAYIAESVVQILLIIADLDKKEMPQTLR